MSDDHLYEEAIAGVVTRTLSPSDIAAAETGVMPQEFLQALRDTGIVTMLAPQELGGADATPRAGATILRALGAAAAPGPVLELILGQYLLAQTGQPLYPGLVTLVFAQAPADSPSLAGRSRWVAPPTFYDVPWAGSVARLLVVLPDGERTQLVASDIAEWHVESGSDAAGEPRDTLRADEVSITVSSLPTSAAATLRLASLLRAAQILGAVEWTLTRSVEYASERKQFGREIGKFQVIQQMLAELAGHTLAAAAITMAAGAHCSEVSVAAARSRLADAADAAIGIGHQVHGALGFSREYALNHRTRRLMAWRDDYGSVLHWRRALAARFVGHSRETFWPSVVDGV